MRPVLFKSRQKTVMLIVSVSYMHFGQRILGLYSRIKPGDFC